MPRAYLCSECVSAGVVPDLDADQGVNDLLVSCSNCGAVDEQATYSRNAVDVHDQFGTLMNEGGTSNIQFKEYAEKKHEASISCVARDFVDQLLDVYLVDPSSRLVERRADHFKAGVKTWYNRARQAEQSKRRFKWGPSTNSDALKVRYILAVAVHVTILESNLVIVNNRLAHLRAVPRHSVPAARGDGTIMAPSLQQIFARANALGPTHIGYLDSMGLLRITMAEFRKLRGSTPSPLEVTLAHVYVISQRLQFLARLPHAARLRHLAVKDLKATAQHDRKTLETAEPDDFVLGSAEWEYIAKVDWNRTFEMAYHLFCAQQVVSLWGIRCTVEMGVALLQWGMMATVGAVIPQLTAVTREMSMPYCGSEVISSRRREELKVFLVGWSTSFPDAGIPVPILPPPRSGTIGNGLRGYASDKRRPIPEYVMAIAAAPVVVEKWRLIAETRLRTRTRALPLDDEFTMAALMFAKAHIEYYERKKVRDKEAKVREKAAAKAAAKQRKVDVKEAKKAAKLAEREARLQEKEAKRRERLAAKASSAPATQFGSRASSVASFSGGIWRGAYRAASQPAPPAPKKKSAPKTPGPPKKILPNPEGAQRSTSPTIETLLATQEDSSDDDKEDDSDEDDDETERGSSTRHADGELGLSGVSSVPFGFSIGPDGFSVATENSKETTTVSVGGPSRGEKGNKRPLTAESIASDEPMRKKRKARRPDVPISPPPTSPSTQARSDITRRSQPSLSPALTDATIIGPIQPSSPTPSLRSITMSPSLTAISTVEPSHDPSTSHIGVLVRERQQYAFYNVYNDQRSGVVVSAEVEKAMNAWVAKAKAKGVIPQKITPQYLAQLGFHGDLRVDDLGPFIRDHPQWSPTECLLRLGVRPVDFPPNLVVHSLLDLEQQLGHFKWEHRLAPVGETLDEKQLDDELDMLFQHGNERWQDLIATPAEADKREALYIKSKAWSYDRTVPEGMINRLDQDSRWYKRPRERVLESPGPGWAESISGPKASASGGAIKASKRIDYSVLDRLVGRDDEDGHGEDEDGEEGLIGDVLHETLWSALGADALGASREDGDDGYDDEEGDDGYGDDGYY